MTVYCCKKADVNINQERSIYCQLQKRLINEGITIVRPKMCDSCLALNSTERRKSTPINTTFRKIQTTKKRKTTTKNKDNNNKRHKNRGRFFQLSFRYLATNLTWHISTSFSGQSHFLFEGSEKFSHPESHNKISNLPSTELFY